MTSLAFLLPILLPILFLVIFLSVLISIVRRINRFSENARLRAGTSPAAALQQTFRQSLDGAGNENAKRLINKLATMKPEQLYGFFQERLPEKYLGEVSRLLTNRNWRREILLFVNRENLWQLLLRANPPKTGNGENGMELTDETDQGQLVPDFEMETAVGLADDFTVFSADKKELKTAKRMEKSTIQNKKKFTGNQKALMRAVIAKEILDRPDFDRK
ncbi:hypothetical protein [Trichococcus pasteurii]|uniref:Uncharacterized protein n=1 Tax=Trichococcus pasteurii TaxID=43064 RepID=A0A1W1ICF3_9LACT|nr:hypothetical protein [Trichococcus pasteurii]SFE40378.1 hypothetical protein SAMN04488086_103161 [Trichococcus pasteurii]SLM50747.1 Hypothetical protein TPAS_419 [Trichococcus pasteurii]SSB91628.1 Hypothetical protein TPAS_419 [Trichococcus pasteurii]